MTTELQTVNGTPLDRSLKYARIRAGPRRSWRRAKIASTLPRHFTDALSERKSGTDRRSENAGADNSPEPLEHATGLEDPASPEWLKSGHRSSGSPNRSHV